MEENKEWRRAMNLRLYLQDHQLIENQRSEDLNTQLRRAYMILKLKKRKTLKKMVTEAREKATPEPWNPEGTLEKRSSYRNDKIVYWLTVYANMQEQKEIRNQGVLRF